MHRIVIYFVLVLLISCQTTKHTSTASSTEADRTSTVTESQIIVDGQIIDATREPELFDSLSATEQALRYAHALERAKSIQAYFKNKWMSSDPVLKDGIEAYLKEREAIHSAASDETLLTFFKNLGGHENDFETLKPRILQEYISYKSGEDLTTETKRLEAAHDLKLPFASWYPGDAALNVASDTPFIGSEQSPVTLTVFTDFQCPYCARADQLFDILALKNKENLKVEFVHFPLSFHEHAFSAAIASMCAHQQGRFTDYKRQLYMNQSELGATFYENKAVEIGLDIEAFKMCVGASSMHERIQADLELGKTLGVRGTPSMYIDGYVYDGENSPDAIQERIDLHLMAKQPSQAQ